MAELIKCPKVIIEGEIHFSDAICWCRARHDLVTNITYHHLKLDKGTNWSRDEDKSA